MSNWMSWNPVTGCTKHSAGCVNCYAERIANYVKKVNPDGKYRNGFKLTLHPEYLDVPLKFKTKKEFFVNSMSDLFHKDVPFDFIMQVFKRMEWAYWHSYYIISKRPERMKEFINNVYGKVLPNLSLGTSVEDNRVKHRMEELRQTNCADKFVNFAPLIGPVGKIDLSGFSSVFIGQERAFKPKKIGDFLGPENSMNFLGKPRPMKKEWVEEIAMQCREQNVPFYIHTTTKDKSLEKEIYSEYPIKIKKEQSSILQFVQG